MRHWRTSGTLVFVLGIAIGLCPGWARSQGTAIPQDENRALGRSEVEAPASAAPPAPSVAVRGPSPMVDEFDRRRAYFKALLSSPGADAAMWFRDFPLERNSSQNILTAPTLEEWTQAAPQTPGHFRAMLLATPADAMWSRESHQNRMDIIAAFHVAGFPAAAGEMLRLYEVHANGAPALQGMTRDEVMASILGARSMVAADQGDAPKATEAILSMLDYYAKLEAAQPAAVRITGEAPSTADYEDSFGGGGVGMAFGVMGGQNPFGSSPALYADINMPMSRSQRNIPVFYYNVDGRPARSEATMRGCLYALSDPAKNLEAAAAYLRQQINQRLQQAANEAIVDPSDPDPLGDRGLMAGPIDLTSENLKGRVDWLIAARSRGVTPDLHLSRAILPLAVTNWAENYDSRPAEIEVATRKLSEALDLPWPDDVGADVARMFDLLPFVGPFSVDTYNDLITKVSSRVTGLGYGHTNYAQAWQEKVREVRRARIQPSATMSPQVAAVLARQYGPSEILLARLRVIDSIDLKVNGQILNPPAWFHRRRASLYLQKLKFPEPATMSPEMAAYHQLLMKSSSKSALFGRPRPQATRPVFDFTTIKYDPLATSTMAPELRGAFERADAKVRGRDAAGAVAASTFLPATGKKPVLSINGHAAQLANWLRGQSETAIVQGMGTYRNWASFDLSMYQTPSDPAVQGAALENGHDRTLLTRALGQEIISTRNSFYQRARRVVFDYMADPDAVMTVPLEDARLILQAMPVAQQALASDAAYQRVRAAERTGDAAELKKLGLELAGVIREVDSRADLALEVIGSHPLAQMRTRRDLNLLPEGTLILEYIRYREVNFTDGIQFTEKYRYGCLVLTPNTAEKNQAPKPAANLNWQRLRFFDLGPEEPIRQAANAFVQACSKTDEGTGLPVTPLPEVRRLGAELRKLIWDVPAAVIEPNREGVYVIPDGDLTLVPFGALALDDQTFLIEKLEICYASSSRDLKKPRQRTGGPGERILIGDVDFDADLGFQDPLLASTGKRALSRPRTEQPGEAAAPEPSPLSGIHFDALPGSGAEITEIARLLGKQGRLRRLTADDATKSRIMRARSPEILHFVTHGVYFSGGLGQTDSMAKNLGTNLNLGPTQNPMLLSGIALSGANALFGQTASYDGFLSAQEISEMDLYGTRLVVVAACESALGEQIDGEGVFGLRRGFALAGTETLVSALWRVPDTDTKNLMTILYAGYTRLEYKRGAGRALPVAQREFLHLNRSQPNCHPYYWGAFVANVANGGMWGEPGNNVAFSPGWSTQPVSGPGG